MSNCKLSRNEVYGSSFVGEKEKPAIAEDEVGIKLKEGVALVRLEPERFKRDPTVVEKIENPLEIKLTETSDKDE